MDKEKVSYLKQKLPKYFDTDLVEFLSENASIMEIPKGTQILREGQFVKVIPIVLEGFIEVMTSYEEKELLLYYIQPCESCIMYFAAGSQNTPSAIIAKTEADTKILALPSENISSWVLAFPRLANLFSSQYDKRYMDLLNTLKEVLYHNMEERIMSYLLQKSEVTSSSTIYKTHQEIADEMSTSREVVSRILKKVEVTGSIELAAGKIRIINLEM
ncbi:MAG TPA: Crp/Fnr family transcriptional regulator [Flavobacteriales bacterium]|jgi:CRP/FNR family transcriptional regulator|nr:Crp/Fnr family transcriptional regulator [Flavobacteriales bacterium]